MSVPRVMMFHGSTDRFLPSILEHGFVPFPEIKLSEAMADPGGHTASLPGTYLTVDHGTAASYGTHAAKHFGGSPMIVCASINPDSLVPDEDEVNFGLGWPITFALGYDPDEDTQLLEPWTLKAAEESITSFISDDPGLRGRADMAALSACLHGLLSPVLGPTWNRSPALVCPDYNREGWSSPAWVRELTATPGGMGFYRNEMDRLCRLLAGMNPDCYPAGFDSCKGRIVEAFKVSDVEGPCIILGIGTPQDPAAHFDGFERMDPDIDMDQGSRRVLERARRMPVLA